MKQQGKLLGVMMVWVAGLGLTGIPTEVGASDLTTGLVAYYPFDGNANDASGNGNHGIENGGLGYVSGKIGSSAKFDGINDYVSVRHNSLLNLGKSFTLSIWVNISTGANDAIRIIDKATGGTCDGWVFDTHDSSAPGLRMRLDVSCPWVNSKTAFLPDQWQHLLVTVDNLKATFYLNGIVDGTGTISQVPSNTLDMYIGSAHPSSADSMFMGQLDEMRIYNRALSQSEIQELAFQSNDCSSSTSTSNYDSGYAAGKAYCVANPSACGITTVSTAGGDSSHATYNPLSSLLKIPYVNVPSGFGGNLTYSVDLRVIKFEPLQFELQSATQVVK